MAPKQSCVSSKKRKNADDLARKHAPKRQRAVAKTPKDSAVFVERPLCGPLNFPPAEKFSAAEASEVNKYKIAHLGHLSTFPRRIPYRRRRVNSASLQVQEVFHALNFEFKVPGYDKSVVILWDYITGMVRITPFFKVFGHGKAVPAQVIDRNGLREQAVSVTGGDIGAQGYWLPFEISKQLAATFCWDIRWALAPLFGADFPSKCSKPGEAEFLSLRLREDEDNSTSPESPWAHTRTSASRAASLSSMSAESIGDGQVSRPSLPGPDWIQPRNMTRQDWFDGLCRKHSCTPVDLEVGLLLLSMRYPGVSRAG